MKIQASQCSHVKEQDFSRQGLGKKCGKIPGGLGEGWDHKQTQKTSKKSQLFLAIF